MKKLLLGSLAAAAMLVLGPQVTINHAKPGISVHLGADAAYAQRRCRRVTIRTHRHGRVIVRHTYRCHPARRRCDRVTVRTRRPNGTVVVRHRWRCR